MRRPPVRLRPLHPHHRSRFTAARCSSTAVQPIRVNGAQATPRSAPRPREQAPREGLGPLEGP